MVSEAVSFNKSRKGTSRAAIHKFIIGTYNVGLTDKAVRSRLNATLKKLVLDGNLKKNKDSYNILSSSVKKAKTSKGDKPSVSQPKKKAAALKPAPSYVRSVIVSISRVKIGTAPIDVELVDTSSQRKRDTNVVINNWRQSPTKDIF